MANMYNIGSTIEARNQQTQQSAQMFGRQLTHADLSNDALLSQTQRANELHPEHLRELRATMSHLIRVRGSG